ncbi:hypothetical protein CY34DRAFT_105659 [Suillus luteus UH-Slu-Lm8-n1]|uniref:DUF6533 domain-containing protein n=1 Tax=Suillus luteus UH-Slu-Lm8-n1 TaxID=930992 RepID=A0A0D0ATU1_9AGAM|nr:hypothetical protein CY34DRAFT_105659 [Suillus luteus UH-Slu-Lm8-n1]
MVAPIVNTGIQTAKYCNVAGLGVLIFDYFLTLEPEIRWTWNRRWNVTRVLFVISRYMAFAAAGMTAYVPALQFSVKCIVAAEGLLIIRTYAFWKQNKRLLAVLLVLAAISIACAVSITQVVNNLAAPPDPSAPPTSNCTFEAGRSSAIQYGFLVAYELCKDMSSPSHLSASFNPIHSADVLDGVQEISRLQGFQQSSIVSIVNILIMSVVPYVGVPRAL